MNVEVDAIYRTRGGSEVGLVLLKLITRRGRFNLLVEYQPIDNRHRYAHTHTELVDYRGFVFGAAEPNPRDLTQFIEYIEEDEYLQ